jgi:replication fork protection complex subunit Tof1/Swi1
MLTSADNTHRYLDTIIHFSYVLLRMLERHSKENAHSMVIRKLKRGGKKKRRQQGPSFFELRL